MPDEPLAPLSGEELATIKAASAGLLSDPASLELPSGWARAQVVLAYLPRLLAEVEWLKGRPTRVETVQEWSNQDD